MAAVFGTPTSRFSLRKMTGATPIPDIDAGVQALADDVDTKMAGWVTGILSARPAASIAGRFFRATDTTQLFLDMGTAWVEIHVDLPGDLKATARASGFPGWLLCDGSAVSRTTYADLFAAIGTTYGAGNGSTTFVVPDLRGRVPIGVDGAANRVTNNDALGQSSGQEFHQHTFSLTVPYQWASADATSAIPDTPALVIPGSPGGNVGQSLTAQGQIGISGAQLDSNMQPYQTVNWVVKV